MTPFLSRYQYALFFFLLGIVYIAGLFVPLMDNDSAHHANIALHMYQTGDYVSLIDNGKDYLDKPHLHFWLVSMSYELFGVNAFAYRFPSLLFSLLAIWSTFQLGKWLYDAETGRLAALLLAASFGFVLANTDVRMDAILTACIIFSTWQLVALLQDQQWNYAAGAALGLALGFSTKGHIAVIIPLTGLFFYAAGKGEWKKMFGVKTWFVLLFFALLLLPEIFCYYLQYNLHPEKTVRGHNNINGVRYLLFGMGTERFQGDAFGAVNKKDHLFFLHSFLWCFAPWSLLAIAALLQRMQRGARKEWLTVACLLTHLLIISFSGFKLPHYLVIVFPTTSILVADLLLAARKAGKQEKILLYMQYAVTVALLVVTVLLNAWIFPLHSYFFNAAVVVLLAVLIYQFRVALLDGFQKAVTVPAAAFVLLFFTLNIHIYPALLHYQGGNELAAVSKGKVDPENVYNWKNEYSASYNFTTQHLCTPFHDSLLVSGKQVWLLYDEQWEPAILQEGYRLQKEFSVPAFRITQLTRQFLDPATRDSACSLLILARISR